MRLQANSSLDYNHNSETINGMTIESTFKPKTFTKVEQKTLNQTLRSKSTKNGGLQTEAKLKTLNMLNQSRLPSIGKQNSANPAHGVNSYNYLKSQWLDIKVQTNDRRQFVRDFAKRQIEPSPVNVALTSTSSMD